jgi:hypothetical protein
MNVEFGSYGHAAWRVAYIERWKHALNASPDEVVARLRCADLIPDADSRAVLKYLHDRCMVDVRYEEQGNVVSCFVVPGLLARYLWKEVLSLGRGEAALVDVLNKISLSPPAGE